MNKKLFKQLALGTLLLSQGLLFTAKADATVSADNQIQDYYDIGPACENVTYFDTQGGTRTFDGNVYSIAFRAGHFLVYPNCNYYKDVPTNTTVQPTSLVDTDFSQVRIYFDATTYKTVDTIVDLNSIKINAFADAGLNFAFAFKNTLTLNNIYKITFNEGFTLPYRNDDSTHNVKYSLSKTTEFKYVDYNKKPNTIDCYYSTDWEKTHVEVTAGQDEGSGEISLLPTAAFTRDNQYKVHIRGAVSKYPDDLKDYDDGTCYLYIFFGLTNYNPEYLTAYNQKVNSLKFDISDSATSYINTLYNKVLLKKLNGEEITLLEASNPADKGMPVYNMSGEKGCLVFKIGNDGLDSSLPSYCAYDFSAVTIKKGAQFPSYAYTNAGKLENEVRYEQSCDISVSLDTSDYSNWRTGAAFLFALGNTKATSLGARNVQDTTLGISGTSIDIELETNSYDGLTNFKIAALGVSFTKYLYVNGRAIYYAYDLNTVGAYINLLGMNNTLSIVLPNTQATDVKEIIIRQGANIPTSSSNPEAIETYGNSSFYYLEQSLSYDSYNKTELTKSSKLVWTIFFDGANPVRVNHLASYDYDTAKPGVTNETQRFINWTDEAGDTVSGYARINRGIEIIGKYVKIFKVTIQGVGEDKIVRVDNLTRLSTVAELQSYIIPEKEGFVFGGYVDEDGNHYNFDNKVTRDITIIATWNPAKTLVDGGSSKSFLGCQNSLLIPSMLVSSISLLGVFFLKSKKKEN